MGSDSAGLMNPTIADWFCSSSRLTVEKDAYGHPLSLALAVPA